MPVAVVVVILVVQIVPVQVQVIQLQHLQHLMKIFVVLLIVFHQLFVKNLVEVGVLSIGFEIRVSQRIDRVVEEVMKLTIHH
jgi:hypothetical protein